MKIHELKTDANVFDQVADRWKGFEIRFNDRDFKIGDYLLLKKTSYTGTEMKAGKPLIYLGQELLVRVRYIMHGPQYGLAEKWVIMAITEPL